MSAIYASDPAVRAARMYQEDIEDAAGHFYRAITRRYALNRKPAEWKFSFAAQISTESLQSRAPFTGVSFGQGEDVFRALQAAALATSAEHPIPPDLNTIKADIFAAFLKTYCGAQNPEPWRVYTFVKGRPGSAARRTVSATARPASAAPATLQS